MSTGFMRSSPLLELHWNGWRAMSFDLERAGWTFHVHKDGFMCRTHITFHNKDRSAIGRTEAIDDYILMESKMERALPVRARVDMAKDINIQTHGHMDISLTPVDMSMEYTRMDSISLGNLFRETESGILLPEDTVPDLMERILELQEPARQGRLKKQVQETNQKVVTVPTKVVQLVA